MIINQTTSESNIHVILKVHGKELSHNGYMLHFGNLYLHENDEQESNCYTFEEALLWYSLYSKCSIFKCHVVF